MREKMENSKDNFNIKIIKTQNNQLEIDKESKRLEKLFYFYRDIEQKIDEESIQQQIENISIINQRLMNNVIDNVTQEDSKFLRRFNHLWNKFTVRKS